MQADDITFDESVIEESQAERGVRMSQFTELDVVEAEVIPDTASKGDTIVCPGCGCWGVREQVDVTIEEIPDRPAKYCGRCHDIVVAPEDVELWESRTAFGTSEVPE